MKTAMQLIMKRREELKSLKNHVNKLTEEDPMNVSNLVELNSIVDRLKEFDMIITSCKKEL